MPRKLPDKLLHWLYNVIRPEYQNPVLCYQDVTLVLMCYNIFQVRTDIYTDESGISRLLVKLYGTQMVHHQPIDIVIWLPLEYPAFPPIIYVYGEDGAALAPNNHLDASGRFYHPFLSEWTSKFGSDKSNNQANPKDNRLLQMVQVLIQSLENHPPRMVEKAPPLPSKPGLPAEEVGSDGLQSPERLQTDIGRLQTDPGRLQTNPGRSISPPLPTKPSELVKKVERLKLDQSPSSISTTKKAAPKLAPLLPANPTNSQLVDTITKSLNAATKQQLFAEVPLEEILQNQYELLQATSDKSSASHYLDYIEEKTAKNEQLVRTKIQQIGQTIQMLDTQIEETVPKFDQYLIAGTTVYNQLYTLVTGVEAMSDLLYHLGRLHERGKIDFQSYLQSVRQLSREQCLLKQHVEKLADICGLDSH